MYYQNNFEQIKKVLKEMPISINSHLQLLRIVSQTGKEDNAQDKEEHQQSELLGRGLERMDEDP